MGLVKNVITAARFLLFDFPDYTVVSIDVENRCNLRCAHCYWWQQPHDEKLNINEWESVISKWQREHPSLIACVWIGGEPLLRPDLIRECHSFFKYNQVITNGTIPLPDWHFCHFIISVDGLPEIHDAIRGSDVYKKIQENIVRAVGGGHTSIDCLQY